MRGRVLVSLAVLVLACVAASPGNALVPKVLVLEHFADYFG